MVVRLRRDGHQSNDIQVWHRARVGEQGLDLRRSDAGLALLGGDVDLDEAFERREVRLRQPLLKNVMAAKKMPLAAAPVPAIAGAVQLQSLQDAVPPVREQACRFLQGSAQEQAAALAEVLASLKEAA